MMKWQPPQSVPDQSWNTSDFTAAVFIVMAFFVLAATLSLAGHRGYSSTVPDDVLALMVAKKKKALGAASTPIIHRATGLIPRSKDPRDVPYAQVFGGKIEVDWTKPYSVTSLLTLLIEDQGSSSSCVAQAWSKLAEIYTKLKYGKPLDVSARDIYWRGFIPPDGGMWGYKGGSILKTSGSGREVDVLSYIDSRPPTEAFMRTQRQPGLSALFDTKIPGYLYVNPEVDEFAHAIERNRAMVFGVTMSDEGWQTGEVRPPLPGEKLYGHFLLGTGKINRNGKRTIEFLNSWGKRWGTNGFGFLSEDYFTNAGNVFGGYVIDDIPENWLPVINTMDVIFLAGSVDQFIVHGTKRHLIRDIETRNFLVELGIILPSARSVAADEFARYEEGVPFPSVKVDQYAAEFYERARDAFEPNKS